MSGFPMRTTYTLISNHGAYEVSIAVNGQYGQDQDTVRLIITESKTASGRVSDTAPRQEVVVDTELPMAAWLMLCGTFTQQERQ